MEEGWPILSPGTTAPWHRAVGIMQNKQKSQTKNIFEGMKSADKTQLLCSKEQAEAQGFLPRSWALPACGEQQVSPRLNPISAPHTGPPVLTPLDWLSSKCPSCTWSPGWTQRWVQMGWRGHEVVTPCPVLSLRVFSVPPETSSPACSLQLLRPV